MEPATSKPPHNRYSVEQKQDYIAGFKKSGLSVKAFCKLQNISESAFRKWQSRYRNKPGQQGVSAKAPAKASGFAELQIAQPSPVPKQSVLFAEVTSIRIYQPVSASYLKDLQ